ncbi:MAG: flagellar protein FlgN [Fibromonadaceae bacterium]|jgi:septal ring factor EnvC (AmiA/AmiB activator)|nr:flagellar protein FlgN [Fibromonadaceae bacterium]
MNNESPEQEFETLIVILGKMKEQYVNQKEVLMKQRSAIISNNTTELTEILSQIENINENINRLETRRIFNTDVLAQYANAETKTIRDIVKAFPELSGKRLETVALELKKEALEVKNISTSNSSLLEISRNIVKETMKIIMTQNVDPRDRAWRTYGNSGAYARTVRREPAHLVNRKG